MAAKLKGRKFAQIKIRLRLELHSRLKLAARKNNIPLNREISNRLQESFDLQPRLSLEDLAGRYEQLLNRSLSTFDGVSPTA